MARTPGNEPIRTLEQASRWLEGLFDVEKNPDHAYRRFSLEPIRRLLERLGRPDQALRILHIAGSKGKGSTALFAESILTAAGVRVGTFTSPHLERWTERFRVDAREIDGSLLAEAVASVRPHVEALRAEGIHASFFDATTAAALQVFRQAGVDCAVLEVGLGGRLDSTNAVAPEVACITAIELEHTDRLGGTLAEIAGEKAGIAKPGVPLVVGALPGEALEAVRRQAAEVGAPLVLQGHDFDVEITRSDLDGTALRVVEGRLEVETQIGALGGHQAGNAALAVVCARRLLPELPTGAFARAAGEGLRHARLPGRVEVLSRDPWIVVDAAHTTVSARSLAAVLAEIGRPVHLVLSISGGKDADSILEALLPQCADVLLTRAEPTRSLDPAEIAAAIARIRPGLSVDVVPNPHLALRAARERQTEDNVLCATGSVYLAGIARGVWA